MLASTPDVDVDREAQTELTDPIRVSWNQKTKMRSRVQERQWDYAASKVDGEWVVDPDLRADDADALKKCNGLAYRVFGREKTNVVMETVEEAQAVYRVLDYYADGAGPHGITWMNGPMEQSVRRVRRAIREALSERGYDTA